MPEGRLSQRVDVPTEREMDVLRLMAQGLTNREIAHELAVSYETAKWYSKQIFSKLGVHNRTHAVARARATGLLTPPSSTALSSSPTTPSRNDNLPAPLTTFVGRAQEKIAVKTLLRGSRLVTLVGPGGVGKTRLALEVGAELLHEYADGVWLVDVAWLRDPQLIPATIAEVLGLPETARLSSVNGLLRAIADKELLLILDNFEHLIEASLLISELLTVAPHLAILVTSRSVLRLSGEHVYEVPPLPTPPYDDRRGPSDYLQLEAVQLFLERAGAAAGEFELDAESLLAVVRICARLEGLPLAIELAAMRMRLLTPQDLLAMLTDRFPSLGAGPRDAPHRQQTLTATMDWSYALLSPAEQSFFARLGVFAGGWAAQAAAVVCASNQEADVLRHLESLVEKSLVQRRASPVGPRFGMLETIREYALERLEEHGQVDEVWERYVQYYLRFAEQLDRNHTVPFPPHILQEVDAEYDNLRTSLARTISTEDAESASQLVASLADYWWYRSFLAEGHYWATKAAAIGGEAPFRSRAAAARTLGMFLAEVGDEVGARQELEDAVVWYRQTDDVLGLAWTLAEFGSALIDRENGKAREYLDEALALFEENSLVQGIAFVFNSMGDLERAEGRFAEAVQRYEASIAHWQTITRPSYRPIRMVLNFGYALLDLGDYGRARKVFVEGLENALRSKRGPRWTLEGFIGLASVLALTDDPELAVILLATAAGRTTV